MAHLVIDRADVLPPDLQRARYAQAAARVRGKFSNSPVALAMAPRRTPEPRARVMAAPGADPEEVVRRVLAHSLEREPVLATSYREIPCFKRSITLREIEREIMAAYGLTRVELWSRSRSQKIVQARQEYFFRARHETLLSLPSIGRLGGFDHTTVLHGVRRLERRLAGGYRMKTRPDVIGVNEAGGMILEAAEGESDGGAT